MMTLLWFLLWAGLFMLMMRFGCGAHSAHAGSQAGTAGAGHDHGAAPSGAAETAIPTDPVCGMPVPADQGYAEVYQGRLLRFCSRTCLDTFDADPHRYAA